MVLLTATLVQMGSKALKHRQGNPQQVPADACTLVAMTMYKEDWQEGDWLTITTNPMGFIRKLLENDNLYQGIHAMWGKSLRSHKSPASPHQALTVQIHLTVEDAKLERLMAKSGFNRLFLTPKTQVGRLNLNYKIIWVSGDAPKLSSLSAKCQSCLGLVRGRQGKGYGLRFANDKHDAAWAILHPGTTPQHEIDRTFLQKHGYLGHFVQDEHAPFSSRFLHPAEVAILHGCCNKVYIHKDMDAAWQHMGNMIAPPHAILVMTNVFQRMSLLDKHIRDIMRDFQDERLTSLNSVFTKVPFGGFVHRHNQTLTQEFVRNTVVLHTVGTPAPGHIWTPEHGFLTCQQFDQHRSTKVTRHFELHPVESPTPDVSCMMTRSVYQTVQQSEDPRSTEPRNIPDQDANQEDLPEDFWSVSGLALHSSAVCPLSPHVRRGVSSTHSEFIR